MHYPRWMTISFRVDVCHKLQTMSKYICLSCRAVALLFTLCLMFSFGFILFSDTKLDDKSWYYFEAPCQTPADVMSDMKQLVFKIHDNLDKLGIPHAVCYGTLWGTLRNGQLLPWDNNVDFCVNALEISKVGHHGIIKQFEENGMTISYSSFQGVFHVKFKKADGYITTFLVGLSSNMFRTGLVFSLKWLIEKKNPGFPSNLLDAPFPQVLLYGKKMPVPHENVEIQKYLYPEDWWLEVKPPRC